MLDIGCGGGLMSESFAKQGAEVVGIDLAPTSIEAAQEHASEGGLEIEYMVLSVADLIKKRPKKFDCIVCSEVLEHVGDLEGFLRDATSLLKKSGLFFFSTINKTLKARFLAIFMAEDILRLVPRGAHEYEKFIKPSRLVGLLKQNKIEAEEIKGMSLNHLSLNSLKMDFKLSRDTSVNYIGYGIKL